MIKMPPAKLDVYISQNSLNESQLRSELRYTHMRETKWAESESKNVTQQDASPVASNTNFP